jgi:hypothetical protein
MADCIERRSFLGGLAGAPSLRLLLEGGAAPSGAGAAAEEDANGRFTPVDLTAPYTGSSKEFGPHDGDLLRISKLIFPLSMVEWEFGSHDGDLLRMPSGRLSLRGIPFHLGPADVEKNSWILLSTRSAPGHTARAEVAIGASARYVCLAQFCDWDPHLDQVTDPEAVPKVGRVLAEVSLVYEDGGEHRFPIRHRFEVNPPSIQWGLYAFRSVAHPQLAPASLSDSVPGHRWGGQQTVVKWPNGMELPWLWICALPNPEPSRKLKALRFRAAGDDPLMVCGVTLFHGLDQPLRYDRLKIYRIRVPQEGTVKPERFHASVDLGVVARQYMLPEFTAAAWVSAANPAAMDPKRDPDGRYLYVEVSAAPDAVLTLEDTETRQRYHFNLRKADFGEETAAEPTGPRIQWLDRERVWLHGKVLDSATRKPTPVRLAFRSKEGRYIPPHGHRSEVERGWFEDYGADLKIDESMFSYIDGMFQIELPVGEVYLHMSKGFEYEAVRRRLEIRPGQRELLLEIPRTADLRTKGWITADTHVHFLSPSTAVLEAQAEGINLVNLLVAQWGDLYTNVGDLSHGPLLSPDRETLVWVGTENRSHVLGHLGLLGGSGEPVYPLSGGFPTGTDEAYFGDPLRVSMAEWSDACRKRGGVTIAVHFPYPNAELAADVVLGKIDAVEMQPRFNGLSCNEWYRYLNCGYRLPVVGGTDKMGAYIAVGYLRTYAYLGQQELTFENWGKAIRSGNTFTTTGPLLLFSVDGRMPGEEILFGSGGGEVEARVQVTSYAPFTRLELVHNGRVIASHEEKAGVHKMTWNERVKVQGPGWLAARCSLRPGTQSFAAHTSPVYLRTSGQELLSAASAAYFMSLIEGTQLWVEEMVTRPDPERFERIRHTLAEAHARLHARIRGHRTRL